MKNLLSYQEFLFEQNEIKGGKGDDTKASDVNPDELKVGIAIEKEHVGDKEDLSKEIALDHLTEDPKYYSKLISAGLVDEKPALDIAKELGWNIGEKKENEEE